MATGLALTMPMQSGRAIVKKGDLEPIKINGFAERIPMSILRDFMWSSSARLEPHHVPGWTVQSSDLLFYLNLF